MEGAEYRCQRLIRRNSLSRLKNAAEERSLWPGWLFLFFFFSPGKLPPETGRIDPFIFSSPSRVFRTFLTMWQEEQLALQIGITLAETLISFFLVVFLSLSLAILLWLCPSFARVLEPYLVVLNSLPKSALAPLLIVWLGANRKTIITAGISVAIFGSVISLYTSFREMNPDKLKLIDTLGGTKRHALFKVILPGSIPYLLSNMKINIGLCLWVSLSGNSSAPGRDWAI